jgi:hypothetical protein
LSSSAAKQASSSGTTPKARVYRDMLDKLGMCGSTWYSPPERWLHLVSQGRQFDPVDFNAAA